MSIKTPMMQQYRRIKQKHKDSVLFFRMGDFYEMFEHDAVEISHILDITLTKRNGIPMCGIPYHAAQPYISKLLKVNKKIAICEQTHIPGPGKGIATREVIEIITPGTVVNDNFLEKDINNYLIALGKEKSHFSLAYIDLSTAEFSTTSFHENDFMENIKRELYRLSPKEIIIQESLLNTYPSLNRLLQEKDNIIINQYPDWYFNLEFSLEELLKQFKTANLKGFGLNENSPEIIAAGVIIDYIKNNIKSLLPHIRHLSIIQDKDYLLLDESTQKNLELVKNIQDGSKRYTLLEVLNHCCTSPGSRKLRQWILKPLVNKKKIIARHNVVNFFYHNQLLLSKIRDKLKETLDLERLSTRLALDKAHAKDLLSIKATLDGIISIYELINSYSELNSYSSVINKYYDEIKQKINLVEKAIKEEPSILLNEGELIKDGYNKELDELHQLTHNVKQVLNELVQKEREKSGINNLKLKFNKIIGYFFEVTKSNLNLVPEYFLRKQSLVGSERYTTEKLTEIESKLYNSSERIITLEKELFLEVREQIKSNLDILFELASCLAEMDVLQSFAFAATIYAYCRPKINVKKEINIIEGRHPVVEANMPAGSFVPNHITLNEKEGTFVLLTGPNMAGKSTFLRQVALAILMCQIGSFVPAQEADICLVDKIFCRVGASDNLARGESTFLVEMNETANILRSASSESLIIMDEVGRGTSTKDGLSIAWAVIIYILTNIRAKTLFATHFHELTQIDHESLIKMTMNVLERDNDVIFLKTVKKGISNNSYGIHVAKLAGLPEGLINHAKEILSTLQERIIPLSEENNKDNISMEKRTLEPYLFSTEEMIIDTINNTDITNITPLQAINLLSRFKDELKQS